MDLPIQDREFVEEVYPELKQMWVSNLFDILTVYSDIRTSKMTDSFRSIVDACVQTLNERLLEKISNISDDARDTINLRVCMTKSELNTVLENFWAIPIESEWLILDKSKRTSYLEYTNSSYIPSSDYLDNEHPLYAAH